MLSGTWWLSGTSLSSSTEIFSKSLYHNNYNLWWFHLIIKNFNIHSHPTTCRAVHVHRVSSREWKCCFSAASRWYRTFRRRPSIEHESEPLHRQLNRQRLFQIIRIVFSWLKQVSCGGGKEFKCKLDRSTLRHRKFQNFSSSLGIHLPTMEQFHF